MIEAHNLKDLPREGVVYVYGAGDGGLMIKRKLEHFYSFAITGFIDAFKRGNVDGIAILRPEQLISEADREASIIIASQAYSDIGQFLLKSGFSRVFNAFPYMSNHVDDIRYRTVAEVTTGLVNRLRATQSATAGLEVGKPLSDALLHDLMGQASWKGRLVLLDFLVAGGWPSVISKEKLAVLAQMFGEFLAVLLPAFGRDAAGGGECVTLHAFSTDSDHLSYVTEWISLHPGRENEISNLLMEFTALARLLPAGSAGHKALFGAGGAGGSVPFHELSYSLHRSQMEELVDDPERELIQSSWFEETNANYAIQKRLYSAASCLRAGGDASWLTVGDGRFGLDAVYLSRYGFSSVIASDISDSLLKQAERYGHSIRYQVENAEALSLASGVVDYILCKEAFHHFPRPMIALYEMLRVARHGVVLVEPQDAMIDPPILLEQLDRYDYETSGNYIYTISRREMVKVAVGLNFPAIAFKGINTAYIRGCEFSPASLVSPIYIELMAQLRERDELCRLGRSKHEALMVIIFKTSPVDAVRQALIADGWDLKDLPRNPYMNSEP